MRHCHLRRELRLSPRRKAAQIGSWRRCVCASGHAARILEYRARSRPPAHHQLAWRSLRCSDSRSLSARHWQPDARGFAGGQGYRREVRARVLSLVNGGPARAQHGVRRPTAVGHQRKYTSVGFRAAHLECQPATQAHRLDLCLEENTTSRALRTTNRRAQAPHQPTSDRQGRTSEPRCVALTIGNGATVIQTPAGTRGRPPAGAPQAFFQIRLRPHADEESGCQEA
jgi:hypothetical protein